MVGQEGGELVEQRDHAFLTTPPHKPLHQRKLQEVRGGVNDNGDALLPLRHNATCGHAEL